MTNDNIKALPDIYNLTYYPTMSALVEARWFSLFKYALYYIIGGAIVLFNGLVLIAVMRHPALRQRKEYISLIALALADVLCGTGYFVAGVYCTQLILQQVGVI